MRCVAKRESDHYLDQRHKHPPLTPKDAERAWSNFRHKNKTRDVCYTEQFGLCAYSENVLDPVDFGMHLDHVEPKSFNPARTFDHNNLLLSAIDDVESRGLVRHEVFGGHYRQNKYSNTDFIHPSKPDSRRFFHYASTGEVEPAWNLTTNEINQAQYTIDILNLNAPILVNRRKHWLAELEQEINTLLTVPTALKIFAELELCSTNRHLRPFHSAVRERFAALGEQVLQSNCPDCL